MGVDAELWRIFTFYSLHYDANQPDIWKITPFVRFAKDCQITGPKFMVSELELEIVRLARSKRKIMRGTTALRGGKDFESTNTVTITFSDFVQLLEVVAQRVYPSSSANGANSMVALRRLMLENVLLMASRRAPKVRGVDVNQQDEAAMVVVRDTYAKTLMGIFKYYLDLADKRRSHEMATEAIKAGAGRASSQNEARCARQIREALSKQKDVIAYKEYTQFCHDFSLKSTALLTAIEVGEVFLNVVPYDHDTKALKGMTFAMFCDALVAMSVLAYRSSAVEHKNKVKVRFLLAVANTRSVFHLAYNTLNKITHVAS